MTYDEWKSTNPDDMKLIAPRTCDRCQIPLLDDEPGHLCDECQSEIARALR